MTREELIESLEDILMLEEGELNLEQNLTNYEDWDSMSYLALIALFDKKLSKKLDIETIKGFKTPNDIINQAGL
ncbi:acyl carrier protein [Aliarcobacter butzleri]|uniref:acyl carrier protein n=1 Tax=Aliarcobacter butzleri TaxID=28197 RepID=UPI0021B47173|nr:acyl carrier protein [Aliarcobacter butzleri]MCT7580021.1 acyl carrier protein [Aliarcobacter butzleri]MCT7584795.1 acyl carrier protein [Aliarcobacter butzleri]